MKKLIFVLALGLVLGIAGSAQAGLTYINPIGGGGSEMSLIAPGGILDILYGSANLSRVDDSLDINWKVVGAPGSASVEAKYAGDSQTLYAGSQALFTVVGRGLEDGPGGYPSSIVAYQVGTNNVIASKSAIITTAGSFRFYDDPSTDTSAPVNPALNPPKWSSNPLENVAYGLRPAGMDRMVTWKINGANNRYVMGWEDWNDQDYQDIVYEFSGIAPVIPEPTSMLLLGMGILGLFGARKKLS